MPSSKSTLFKLVQSLKVHMAYSIVPGRLAYSRLVHNSNTLELNSSTLSGTSTHLRLAQFINACICIVCNVSGNVIAVKSRPANPLYPIDTTPGISNFSPMLLFCSEYSSPLLSIRIPYLSR